jgi:hypothetical protein
MSTLAIEQRLTELREIDIRKVNIPKKGQL